MRLNRKTYEEHVKEAIAWVKQFPHCLERMHCISTLECSIIHNYGTEKTPMQTCYTHGCHWPEYKNGYCINCHDLREECADKTKPALQEPPGE